MKAVLQAARDLSMPAQSIIHRDIKPGNLIYDKAGNTRILDLGLVRFEDSTEASATPDRYAAVMGRSTT